MAGPILISVALRQNADAIGCVCGVLILIIGVFFLTATISIPVGDESLYPESRPAARDTYARMGSDDLRLHLVILGGFLVLPHLVYVFLWWVPSHYTLGNDYPVHQPGQQLLFMQAIRDGYFPLWAPADTGGRPFASYMFSGQYSPVLWLLLGGAGLCKALLGWEPVFSGYHLEVLTHIHLFSLSMAGFFTFLLMRRLSLSVLPAVLAGGVFIFNFRMLDAFRFGTALDVVVWLPVMIYLAERMVSSPKLRFALLYAAAQYMLMVQGHLQEALYCIYFANLYVLVRIVAYARARGWGHVRREWRCRAVCFGFGQVLGFGLCVVMLLPVVVDVLPLFAERTSGDPTFGAQHHMTTSYLASNVFYPWLADVHSAFYCCQLVWILFAVGVVRLTVDRSSLSSHDRTIFVLFAITLMGAILYSLGPLTPVARGINAVLPCMQLFRCPGRVLSVGVFAMAGVSAFGLDALLRPTGLGRKSWTILAAGFAVYLVAALVQPAGGVVPEYSPLGIHRDARMASTMTTTIVGIASVGLLTTVLVLRGRFRVRAALAVLLVGSVVEVGVYHRRGTWLTDGRVYSAQSANFSQMDIFHRRVLGPDQFFTFQKDIVSGVGLDGRVRTDEISPGPVRELLSDGGAPAWRIYHQTVPGHEFPRAYVTPRVRLVHGNDLEAIASANPRLTSIIDVTDKANHNAADDASLQRLSTPIDDSALDLRGAPVAVVNASVDVIEYTFNKAVFDVRTDQSGFFHYADAYASGWRARMDGQDVPVYRANHVFKGVVLPPGNHRVEFVYDPASFRVGLIISLVSLSLAVALAVSRLSSQPMRRIMLGCLAVACAAPGAWMAYGSIYSMAHRGGLINYDPKQSALTVPDYVDFLAGAKIDTLADVKD